jgi:DNA-binding MarR family transcriptional regulator
MSRRNELTGTVAELLRRQSGTAVVLHQAVATRFGLGPADIKCLDLITAEPEVTAGRIAELTALSTSAVTAMLDRLERRGFVQRHRDPGDRRRVFVRSTGVHEGELAATFAPLATATAQLLAGFSEAELAVVERLLRRLTETSDEFIANLPPVG